MRYSDGGLASAPQRTGAKQPSEREQRYLAVQETCYSIPSPNIRQSFPPIPGNPFLNTFQKTGVSNKRTFFQLSPGVPFGESGLR